MDLLQESSSIWNDFLRKPCPRVELLSFWLRHPWHLLNPGTLGTFCSLKPLAPFKPWHPWHLLSLKPLAPVVPWRLWYTTLQHGTVQFGTETYSTVWYRDILYCTLVSLFWEVSWDFKNEEYSKHLFKLSNGFKPCSIVHGGILLFIAPHFQVKTDQK